jgi:GTP cyclohydrolase I
MAMRGARSDALMTTSVMRGKFRDTPALRSEFLSLCR